MAVIKGISEIADKWASVTPGRATYYETGVATTQKDWAAVTANAQDTYERGVSEAVSRGAFAKGVQDAGTAKWRESTLAKKARWGEGVRLGKDNYATGFAPFRAVIESVQLPPRGPRGDPANYERSQAIGAALSAARKAGR